MPVPVERTSLRHRHRHQEAQTMMKIQMVTTERGSPDGNTVLEYEAGEEYEVPEELGEVFVREGWAKPAEAPAAEKKPAARKPAARKRAAKAKGKAPADKSAGAAPENKAAASKRPRRLLGRKKS
jgi:hypothetical protein